MKSISTAQYRSLLRVSISHCHQEHHYAPWHAETVQDHYLLKYKRLRPVVVALADCSLVAKEKDGCAASNAKM
jgi:hypothetical protein